MPHDAELKPKSVPPQRDAEQVREDIERAREQLAASALALKEEVAATVDWKAWVRERPIPFVVGAFALGLYLGTRRGR